MSSNRPPQLQLSHHAENGTSFKRSFEQYGFDMDPPLSGSSDASGSASLGMRSGGGNDRNKRARSESSLSNSDEIAESSGSSEMGGAGSSGATSIEDDSLSGFSVTRPMPLASNALRLTPPVLAEPPRLPTPNFEDIQISVLDDSGPLSPPSVQSPSTSDHEDSYRISLERFNAFDSQISALRQPNSRSPASPPILPPLSLVTDDGEANSRIPSHPFRTLELVEEDSNIPGLQVFTLGNIRSSEHGSNRREAAIRFQSVFDGVDENPTLESLPQNNSPEPPQPRFSTTGFHARGMEHPGRPQLPSTLPRFSPAPLFSPQDLEWWSSEPSNGHASRPPSRSQPVPPRGATDYMPPRNWFDEPLDSRDRRTGTTPSAGSAPWGRRRDTPRSRDPQPRYIDVVDDVSDEDRPVPFPTVVQLALDRFEQERSVVEQHLNSGGGHPFLGPSSGLSEEGHRRQSAFDADLPYVARADRQFERAQPPLRSRISLASRSHETPEDVDRRVASIRFRLPRIETSDVDLDLRPSLLDHMYFDGQPSPRSPDSGISPFSSNVPAARRSSADRMATMPTYFRRSMPFDQAPSSSTNTSRLRPSTSNDDSAESSEMDLSTALYHTGDPPGRLPSFAPEQFHSRSYSSRVAASNSLVSENAAELRRRLARSQMLQTPPQDDDMLDDLPTLLGTDNPWRARRESDWIQPDDHVPLRGTSGHPRPRAGSLASDSSSWRDHSGNPLLRPYSSSPSATRTIGRPDDGGHRFNSSLGSPSDSAIIRRVAPAPSAGSVGHNRTPFDAFTHSQFSAMSATPPPSSRSPGLPLSHRQIPQRTRTFSASIDPSRARPFNTQRHIAWEDGIYSTSNSPLDADPPTARQLDHDLTIRARRRSSLVDGILRSPSPFSPIERAPRSPEPARATHVSTYENFDLSTYHEGPFRASVQRYADRDRITRSRHNRLGTMTDNVFSESTSSQPPLPPTLPPLRFDSDDDLLSASRRAPNSSRYATSSSPTNDQDLNFPHMVREARLGRGTFPTPATLPSSQTYGPNIGDNGNARENSIRERNHWVSSRARMESSSDIYNSASPYQREDESRLRGERFNANDARGQPYRNYAIPNSAANAPANTRVISPTQPQFAGVTVRSQTDRVNEGRTINHSTSIHARVRAQMDPRNQARINARRAENASASGFGEAMDIDVPGADGLSNSQRQFFDRYQAREATGHDEISPVDNDLGESGSRFWPTRARYARRGRYRISHAGESAASGYSTRQHRASSHSPARNSSGSERLAATVADRAARLRAPRERVHREREFMLGDLPRFDLLHYTQRPGRNMGDYMRDEDFDSSYENLISLASTLGEARPKATPNHVIAALPTGFYKDWQTTDSDQRCPICLDDYKPLDPVLRLSDCSHWLHKGCLEQWLHGASTCPVCRKCVGGARCPRYQHGLGQGSSSGSNRRQQGNDDDVGANLPEGFGSGTPPWRFWE